MFGPSLGHPCLGSTSVIFLMGSLRSISEVAKGIQLSQGRARESALSPSSPGAEELCHTLEDTPGEMTPRIIQTAWKMCSFLE